jgi:hypothetical protein
MASAHFSFASLLVIYAAQRAAELRATLGRPRFATLPKSKRVGSLTSAAHPA